MNDVTVRKSVDVGVLSCGAGEVCVEDSTSTMGGRCEIHVSPDDEAAALEPQRERKLCEKCVGENACYGVDQSKIGCGSCIGVSACVADPEFPSDVTIGENSCVGKKACRFGSGELRVEYCMVGWQQNLPMKICFLCLHSSHLLRLSFCTVSVGDNSW